MSWNDRVVWSEGQFLLPQMFQQQERYLEHVMHYRSLPLTPFFWGFSHYNIDGEALNIGKLILKEASGIFLTARRLTRGPHPAAAATDHSAGAPEPADLSGGTGTRAEQRRNHV